MHDGADAVSAAEVGAATSSNVLIRVGGLQLTGCLERDLAPRTCEVVESLLPFRGQILHARWCGEAMWTPLDDVASDIGAENPTSFPEPGQVLFYCGPVSVTEILLPYGSSVFMSKVGHLAGNHFLTIVEGRQELRELGELVLWKGAQDILFERG